MPLLNPIDLWESRKKLMVQVFRLVKDGDLTRTEVLKMTNMQRNDWLKLMADRAKQEKEARQKASPRSR